MLDWLRTPEGVTVMLPIVGAVGTLLWKGGVVVFRWVLRVNAAATAIAAHTEECSQRYAELKKTIEGHRTEAAADNLQLRNELGTITALLIGRGGPHAGV